jgi:hypothetical protein
MKIDEITCWKGYRKSGTQAGTGKNKGKRVNKCVKELYKQKDGDYALDSDPKPTKKKRGPHPLGGKLVG